MLNSLDLLPRTNHMPAITDLNSAPLRTEYSGAMGYSGICDVAGELNYCENSW